MSFNRFVPPGIAGPASARGDIPRPGRGRPRRRRGARFAVGCSPPPRSLTPPRPPLPDQRSRAARGCGADQIVRKQKSQPVPPTAARLPLLRETSSDAVGSSAAVTAQDQYRGPLLPECRGVAGARAGRAGTSEEDVGLLLRQVVLVGVADGLGAVAGAGFVEDAVDVGLDGGVAEDQLVCDLVV